MLLLDGGGGSAGRGEETIDVSPSSNIHIQIHPNQYDDVPQIEELKQPSQHRNLQ